MKDAIKWQCLRRGNGGCEILVMEHEGWCVIDLEGKKKDTTTLNCDSMFESSILEVG
jgi:hypothetical protein